MAHPAMNSSANPVAIRTRQKHICLQAIAVAVAFLLVMNSAVGWLGRNAVPRTIVRRIANEHDLTHVFLGNSVAQSGFDAEKFNADAKLSGRAVRACNVGLGWSTPAEHAVLWDQVLKAGHRPETVFYGFFDLKLHEPPDTAWWALAGNSAMSYFVNPKLSARYYAPHSPMGRLFMQGAAYLPLFTERVTIWAKVEKLRRDFSEIGMRHGKLGDTNGETQDPFRALEAKNGEVFARDCEAVIASARPFHPAIDDLIASAREYRCRLVFVEMPMPPAHRQEFYFRPQWRAYNVYLKERLAAAGAELLEAEDWVPESGAFADAIHLGKSGAEQFTARLERTMIEQQSVSSAKR